MLFWAPVSQLILSLNLRDCHYHLPVAHFVSLRLSVAQLQPCTDGDLLPENALGFAGGKPSSSRPVVESGFPGLSWLAFTLGRHVDGVIPLRPTVPAAVGASSVGGSALQKAPV